MQHTAESPMPAEVRYQVVDSQSGRVMGEYSSRRRATNRADKLDLTYGAVRYVVTFKGSGAFASRFAR